jgi:crotonobetainyl-CoA:carnitine CoA-transferase CaiB-like acyl-CoA transferase
MGKGTVVDAAIYDGAAHLQNLFLSVAGDDQGAADANPLVGAHWSRTYRCADGRYLSVQCLEPKFYKLFLDGMGLASDADFTSNQFERAAWPRLSARLATFFAEHPSSHWEQVFDGSDACVAPVLSPYEAADHVHNVARQTWHRTQDGLQAAAAPRFSGQPTGTPNPIPERGQHSKDIRARLASGSAWLNRP